MRPTNIGVCEGRYERGEDICHSFHGVLTQSIVAKSHAFQWWFAQDSLAHSNSLLANCIIAQVDISTRLASAIATLQLLARAIPSQSSDPSSDDISQVYTLVDPTCNNIGHPWTFMNGCLKRPQLYLLCLGRIRFVRKTSPIQHGEHI